MKVINNRIAVRIASTGPSQTPGGLFIASNADSEQNTSGTVTNVGSEVTEVAVGDRVFFNRFQAAKITTGEGERFIITDRDVLAIDG